MMKISPDIKVCTEYKITTDLTIGVYYCTGKKIVFLVYISMI